jgi:hypothetical protein
MPSNKMRWGILSNPSEFFGFSDRKPGLETAPGIKIGPGLVITVEVTQN